MKIWKMLGLIRLYIYNTIISKIPINSIRLMFIRRIITLGKNSNVCTNVKILYPGWNRHQIEIGDNCAISPDCLLDGRFGKIIIKNNVDISRGTWIFTLEHDPHSDNHNIKAGDVIVNENVWIASRAIILPGVSLGLGCVIAAGSIVTKDIPSMAIAGGIPAKVISQRKSKLQYRINYFPFLNV